MSRIRIDCRVLFLIVAGTLSASLACRSHTREPRPVPLATDSLDTEGKSLETMMVARFPGVSVTRTTDGGLQIRIRGGGNSFYGGDEPLILVDGTPLPPGSHSTVFLNPHDIEKIEVLKNPQDTALYGIRGGNGVVKITTKRPGRR